MEHARPLAILGATGYTGRLVVERARELGLPLRLVGRRRDALERLARQGEDVRVADARHEQELIDAFAGAFAVASIAGPFLEVGTKPIGAAIAVGAHYLDTSVEQEFIRTVYDGFDESADERGLALLPSFGVGYAVGDFAARLAAEGLGDHIDEVVVAYSAKGLRTSRGTRRTGAFVLTQRQVAWEDGVVPSRFGQTTRRVSFPEGTRGVVEFAGAEPLTVPRHTRVRRVRSYVAAPRIAALGGVLAPLGAPAARLAGRLGGNPSAEQRARWQWTVVAEARAGSRRGRAILRGTDVYAATALLIARGAEALRSGGARDAGALAPAQAFDARSFAARLEPLVEVVAVEAG